MKKTALALALSLGTTMAYAQQQPPPGMENMWVGAGLSLNQLSGFDDSLGMQVFVGHNLAAFGQIRTGVELGYMDTRDFDPDPPVPGVGSTSAQGVWASALGAWALNERIDLLGRLGADFGDDDGLLWGFGAAYRFTPQMHLRGEYVQRDTIDSLQANFVYFFR
ncbi:porin family protein [Ectothiorhodospiraceae bacterium 2226]|nr:porin family protein [Ectothiorhodospiraceae bacterium 2226]